MWRSVAATAATAWPLYSTLEWARTFSAIIRALPCSWAKSMPPCAVMGKSAAVATARTPGRAAALLVLMERIRAWA